METLEVRHLIGGRWEGDLEDERTNPARPDDVVTRSARGDRSTVDRAIEAAVVAQRAWARTAAPDRGSILQRAAGVIEGRLEEMAAVLTREEGKTLNDSRAEVSRAADILRFYGGEGWRMGARTYPSTTPGNRLVFTRREALGVVATITPWNFPILIPTWKLAPALVAGNAVVLKPAQITPGSAWYLSDALLEAGLPPGVLSLVLGSGSVVGQSIVEDHRVAAVSFTGSAAIGAALARNLSARRARVQLEMGGKNALVVLDDADPAAAARIAAAGGFSLTGQACTATSRVICTPGVRDAFVEAFAAEAARYEPGDGLTGHALMGPVVSRQQAESNVEHVHAARSDGSTVVTGLTNDGSNLFQAPVILQDVEPDQRIAQEEVFGPVVSVLSAADLTEAIELTNRSRYGLAAAIVTNDLDAALRFSAEVETGVVKVNEPTNGVALNVPFGGVKESSSNSHREQGSEAVEFYSWTKSVYVTPSAP